MPYHLLTSTSTRKPSTSARSQEKGSLSDTRVRRRDTRRRRHSHDAHRRHRRLPAYWQRELQLAWCYTTPRTLSSIPEASAAMLLDGHDAG